MKNKNKLGIAAAALLALTPALRAAEVEVKTDVKNDNKTLDVRTDRSLDVNTDRIDRNSRVHSGVETVNKASGLIGMEVKNQQGEKLGEVKDLVLDLQSGKVSYAVLAVGGFLGIGEKLLAVPPSAFTPAADHHNLVLNADREKIRNAPGFAATAWPEVNNPSWGGDAYWTPDKTRNNIAPELKTRGEVTTTPRAELNVNTDASRNELKVRTDVDRDSKVRTDLSRDRTGTKLYADAKKDTATRKDVEANASVDTDRRDGMTYRGTVKSVNSEERTIVINGNDGTRTFNLSEKPRITVGRIANPTLVDLKPGYTVEVGYHKDSDGKLIVHSVEKSDR